MSIGVGEAAIQVLGLRNQAAREGGGGGWARTNTKPSLLGFHK
jgi:hypothetical protein